MQNGIATSRAAAIIAAALCVAPLVTLSAQQRATLTATSRTYTVGDSSVSERVATMRLETSGARLHFVLDGSLLRFAAPSATIQGSLPLSARLDFAVRPGDTLSAFVRTASRPLDLTSRETSALSTAGTSTVDLESASLGTPAVGGLRLALAFPVGNAVLAARAGFETEPRPAGTSPVYWRGSTVRGGLALTTSIGESSWTASAEATHSTGDSLGGRNLFPGGGGFTLQLLGDLSVTSPFDPLEDEQWPIRAVAFYGRPFGNVRADQPNLIIPQGDLFGALGTMLMSAGDLTIAPSLQLLRESSTSESVSGQVRSRNSGSAWTATTGLDVSIPLGSVFELTPQVGYTFGSVEASYAQTTVLRRGRGLTQSASFSDSIRGTWIALQLAALF